MDKCVEVISKILLHKQKKDLIRKIIWIKSFYMI